jgi:hypothetical protein
MREGKPNKAAVKAAPVRNAAFVTPAMPDTLEDADTWAAIWELGGPAGVFNPVADYGLISRYCSLLERRDLLMAEIAVLRVGLLRALRVRRLCTLLLSC